MSAPASSNGHPRPVPSAPLAPRRAELLRIATAGSVDDGKSTLIGRLLHDAKGILEDQMAHLQEASARRGSNGEVNLALLTDGLRAEREQGITIDVAYRFFATTRRSFIIADTPGHEQYTRNMVTGASTADLSLILVDARRGLFEQTRRHAYIASLLRTPHVVLCINKMDLVDYDESVFDALVAEFGDWAARLALGELTCVPVSALRGDNVVERSAKMPWYEGPTLLHHLEHVHVASDRNLDQARLPVQWVIRPEDGAGDYRGYAGRVAGGVIAPGDEVVALPGGARTRIASVETLDGPLERAFPPLSVTVTLTDAIDVGRGDVLCHPDSPPTVARELEADVCWMSEEPLTPGAGYLIKHGARTVRAAVEELRWLTDVTSLEHVGADRLALNDIGRVRLRLAAPLAFDAYAVNRATGSFIVIDEDTNATAGAGMIVAP